MRSKHKIFGITVAVIFSLVAIGLLLIPFRQHASLRSLEKEVNNISFPANVGKIAIKSAIGDSGGNGNYSTLRVVVVIKTELDINRLKETIENMDLYFPNHYSTVNNIPIYYITPCNGAKFKSPRQFALDFNELIGLSDYNGYYFIEFVE